ncbi:MAG TPA: Gmad2 immunoglobulin-like domain-containing protein [Mycobacteriales bacterium]|nr:Gmad2 immunoglobulin-like domain-containing protein [Mycobacteriales bacterium]
MNAEEKLRSILRAEAEVIDASPAGWDRIREGIAVRRRRRLWLRSSLAATTAMSLVALGVVFATRGTDSDVGSTIVPATAAPAPSPIPSAAQAPADRDAPLPVIWPLTTLREIDFWQDNPQSRPALRDPETAAREFVLRYLGLADARLEQVRETSASSSWTVSRLIVAGDENTKITVTTVDVTSAASYPVDSTKPSPFLVTSAASDALTVTAPDQESRVSVPVIVRGTVRGVDESVLLEVRAHNPAGAAGFVALTKGFVPAGAEQPWETSLTFNDPPNAAGVIYATTASPADGQLSAVTAVPVVLEPGEQATAAPQKSTSPRTDGAYPAQFVAVERGRLAVFETKSGKRVRFLTEELPGGGVSDPSTTPDGTSVVYVQGEGTCAASIRRVPVDGGDPEVLLRSNGTSVPRQPVLSSLGDLAYIEELCQREDSQIVVQRSAEGAGPRTIDPGSDGSPSGIAWSADGRTLAVINTLTLDSPTEILLVDPAIHRGVEEGEKQPRPPEPEGADCAWSAVDYGDAGVLHAAQICHSEIADAGVVGGRLIEFEESGPRVMLSIDDVIAWFDVDATGDHILLGALACGETCEDADESVQRFSIDGEPVKVADGLTQPVWVG